MKCAQYSWRMYGRPEINENSVSKTSRKGNRCGEDENGESKEHEY